MHLHPKFGQWSSHPRTLTPSWTQHIPSSTQHEPTKEKRKQGLSGINLYDHGSGGTPSKLGRSWRAIKCLVMQYRIGDGTRGVISHHAVFTMTQQNVRLGCDMTRNWVKNSSEESPPLADNSANYHYLRISKSASRVRTAVPPIFSTKNLGHK